MKKILQIDLIVFIIFHVKYHKKRNLRLMPEQSEGNNHTSKFNNFYWFLFVSALDQFFLILFI